MATPEMVDDVLRIRNGVQFMSAKKRRALETVSSQDEYQQTVISSADGAKVLKNLDSLAKEYEENAVTHEKTFLGNVAEAIGAKPYGSNSQYATFETVNGKIVTMRLADHNATVSNFDIKNESEGISIVVSAKKSEGIDNDGDAHIVEYYYDAIKLRKAEGKPLAEIVKSLKQALYSGVFNDSTGLAEYQEVNIPEFHIAYHGSGAKFDKFDHSHMGEGEGNQAFGWGTYVTEVNDIAEGYAIASVRNAEHGIQNINAIPEEMQGEYRSLKEEYNEAYRGHRIAEDEFKSLRNHVKWLKEERDEYIKRASTPLSEQKLNALITALGSDVVNDEFIETIKQSEFKEAKKLEVSITIYESKASAAKAEMHKANDRFYEVEKSIEDFKRKLDLGHKNLYTIEIPDDTGDNYIPYDKEIGKDIRAKVSAKAKDMGIVIRSKMTGEALYDKLLKHFNTAKDVSMFLSECGIVGIKYPANYRSGGNVEGKSNFVIFNESDMKITDRFEFLQTPDGVVYGWTIGGKIFLTEQGMNAETPIHEYTHLWANAMRKNNEQGWESVKDLLRGTPMWNEVLADKNYSSIHDNEDLVASEVLSRYSGKENAKRLEDEAQRMLDEAKGIGAKADAVSLIDRVRRALQKFWDWVGKDLFGIEKFDSIEEVSDRVLYDLMNQTDLNAEVSEGESQQERYSLRTKPAPKKTIKVYKLFNVDENGNPQALFIDATNSLEVGVWYDADSPTIKDLENLETEWSYLLGNEGNVVDKKPLKRGKGGNFVGLPSKADVNKATQEGQRWMTVSTSKSGEKAYHTVGINGAGGVSTYALRPGWHATNVPSARHIGVGKDGANAKYRGANQRWFEIEISADVDYNEEARERYLKAHPNYSREKAYSDLKGDIPERIPEDGYYNFKTNSNANPNQDWYIAGAIKIVRPLTEEEGHKISRSKGIAEDLPYKDGVKNFDEENKKTSISERSGAVPGNSSSDRLLEKSNEHLSRYPLTTNQDTAKLQQNSQVAIASAQKVINKGGFDKAINSPNDAVRELGKALKLEKSKSSMSYYGDFYEGIFYADGKILKLRVSTHPANGERIGNDNADDKISIVIHKDGEHISKGEHNGFIEYVYEPSEISPKDAAMSILKSVKTLLEEGVFVDESNKAHGQNYPYIDSNGKIHYSLQGGRSVASEYERRVNTKGKSGALHLSKYNAMEAMQDEMRSLKEVQRIIEDEHGIKLESYEDAYKAENALSSKNLAEWERYIGDVYEPMMQIIDKWINKGGETEQSINYYLIAKSGLERNREFTVRDAFAEMSLTSSIKSIWANLTVKRIWLCLQSAALSIGQALLTLSSCWHNCLPDISLTNVMT